MMYSPCQYAAELNTNLTIQECEIFAKGTI